MLYLRYRHPVETVAEAQGMVSQSTSSGIHMAEVQPSESGIVCLRGDNHCPLWFTLIPPAPLGPDAMVQEWPRLHMYAFPPTALLPAVLARACLGLSSPPSSDSILIGPCVVCRPSISSGCPPMGDPNLERLSLSSEMIYPWPEIWKIWV